MKRNRLRRLLENDISLLAYHLPLDAHDECGNNVQLAHVLGFSVEGSFGDGPVPLARWGRLSAPTTTARFPSLVAMRHLRAGHPALYTEPMQRVGHAQQNIVQTRARTPPCPDDEIAVFRVMVDTPADPPEQGAAA